MDRSDDMMDKSMEVFVSFLGSFRVGVGLLRMVRFVTFIWWTNSCDFFVDLLLPQMG